MYLGQTLEILGNPALSSRPTCTRVHITPNRFEHVNKGLLPRSAVIARSSHIRTHRRRGLPSQERVTTTARLATSPADELRAERRTEDPGPIMQIAHRKRNTADREKRGNFRPLMRGWLVACVIDSLGSRRLRQVSWKDARQDHGGLDTAPD